MPRFDVNAARAQRLEALGRDWEFEIDGETYSLPTELPRQKAKALQALDDSDVEGLFTLLMGEDQYARFTTHEMSMQDVAAIITAYGSETGMGLGEGSASASS
ncbi:hypothetical protein [Yinghuangia soli]|uniref:Tail assembly chaperone n=1 Tax=Yinghuangia soli TaxID=2908204 RepID=A0AA41Q9B0_9ACTN|nr:hypothetical protein [Yinghuangia soli]MCF2532719.1 hypothetical protein [Yinghuangia soli]